MLRRLTSKVPRLITQLEGSPAEQRLDQRAFRLRAVGALRDHVLEHSLHTFQICDLRSYIVKVGGGNGAYLGAGLVTLIDEMQQLTDFIQREAEFARSQDKPKAPLVRRVVAPITAGRARAKTRTTAALAWHWQHVAIFDFEWWPILPGI